MSTSVPGSSSLQRLRNMARRPSLQGEITTYTISFPFRLIYSRRKWDTQLLTKKKESRMGEGKKHGREMGVYESKERKRGENVRFHFECFANERVILRPIYD
jgi:hypothetical protein